MNKKIEPICFIAARGGSKGVPHKNIRKLGNKPLIGHAIESALISKLFQLVIVSTDDKEISKISKKFGATVPFLRPKNLATDTASGDEVLLHGIRKLISLGYKFDTIVERDCTVPFIRNEDIEGAIELFNNSKCDAVFGVYTQHHNPYFNMMELNSEGFLRMSKIPVKTIKHRQKVPKVYQLNGLFVINVKEFLKKRETLKLRAIPYEIPMQSGWMIDTEWEFRMAELMYKYKLNNKS